MLLENKQIAIVGGGPGGLTLARLLELKGVRINVYERDADKNTRQQGATLDLHEGSGLEAIKKAELEKEFYANYRPNAGRIRVLDNKATIHLDDHIKNEFDDSRPEIDRGSLRDILINSLKEETIIWDSQFLSMEKQNTGWLLHFKNGKSFYADIVIGADGANSKIRSYITDIKPIYSGITIVEGNIYNAEKHTPKLWSLIKGGKIFAFGDEQSLILSTKGEGSLSFYTGCKVAENWVEQSNIDFNSKEQVFSWFKTTFGSWNDIYQELFASDEMWFIPRPQYHFPLDQSWTTLSNLTMIGDAAHRMPPYAGEGANMAMQDAFELAECLTSNKFADIQIAIAYYEKQMLKRASEVTQMTLNSIEILHSDDPINQMLSMFNEVK